MYTKRITSILLSLLIALTFIPSMAFAGDTVSADDPSAESSDVLDSESGRDEDSGAGADSGTVIDSDQNAGSDSDPGAASGADSDADPDADSEVDPAADTNTDNESGDDTEPLQEAPIAFAQDSISLDMTDLCNYKETYDYDNEVYYTLDLSAGEAVSFDTSDVDVAYIYENTSSNAVICLRKPGNVVITAKDLDGNTAECELNISASIRELSLYYYNGERGSSCVKVGDSFRPSMNVYPDFAEVPEDLQWSSSDSSFAEVDSSGTVTVKKYGPVTITASYGDIEDSYELEWEGRYVESDELFNYYVYGEDVASIEGYKGTGTVVTVPDQIDGYTVTGIDSFSCINNAKVTNVTLPNTIKTIGESAFYEKDYLKQIVIPASVTSIGEYAFYGCNRLQKVVINSSAEISYRAFNYCPYLSSVTFNGKTKKIGVSAFEGCDKLSSVTLPEGLESIGKEAFAWSGLKSVTLPHSLKTIGEEAFSGNTISQLVLHENVKSFGNTGGIALFKVNSANPYLTAKSGVLFSKDGKTLIQHPGSSKAYHYSVPSGTVTIGAKAFQYSDNLRQFDLPETVKTIGSGAFRTWGDYQVVLPKSLKTIGSSNINSSDIKIFYRGTKADWGKIDIDVYGNDGLLVKPSITYGYTKKSLKLSKASISCTLAQTPYVRLTYNDGKAVSYKNIKCYSAYDYDYDHKPADVWSSKSNIINIDPNRVGKFTVCVVANGLATELTINVTGKTPISKVPFQKISNETYTGKAIKAWVSTASSALYSLYSDDYTVTYQNNKNVGTAKIIIKGKNRCTGTVTKTFKILPRQTTYFTQIKPGKKSLSLKWKKQKNITGYQIQYSTNNNFKGAKTITIKKNSTVKKKIKKLKAKKAYYIRMRVYKKVGKANYFSDWSYGYTQVNTK